MKIKNIEWKKKFDCTEKGCENCRYFITGECVNCILPKSVNIPYMKFSMVCDYLTNKFNCQPISFEMDKDEDLSLYGNILRCQEICNDLTEHEEIDVSDIPFWKKVEIFTKWAREYMAKENESTDWIQETDSFFTEKLINAYATEKEYVITLVADVDIKIKAKNKKELLEKADKLCATEHYEEQWNYVYLDGIKFVTDSNGNEIRR